MLGAHYSMQSWHRCSTSPCPQQYNSILGVPSLAEGAPRQIEKGCTDPTSWRHCVASNGGCLLLHDRPWGIHWTKLQKDSCISVSHWENSRHCPFLSVSLLRSSSIFPTQPHLNKGAVVRAAQNQHYTSLQISILNDFLFTTEFYCVSKNG